MGISWMATGAASANLAQQAEAEQEQMEASRGKLWRFFLKEGEEARITFIDGDLNHDGFLLPPRFYEHNLQINGKWGHTYVCPEKTMPDGGHKCPICASGDKPSLVALFTIIDHREIQLKSKDGKPGKIIKDQRRLLVAKPKSMEFLAKIAQKRGGLARATFDVTRMGDNSASIGSMFDFTEKNELSVLQAAFVEEVEVNGLKQMKSYFVPADYEKEIVFRTPEELLKLGVGVKAASGFIASKAAGSGGLAPGGVSAPSTDYSKQL